MRTLFIVTTVALLAGCGGRKTPVKWDQLAASEAVKVLRGDNSPYRIIYYPPVDLARKPGS